jgi:DNA-binding NarL/FixJ family response regulator
MRLKTPRILIIEDNENFRNALKSLIHSGYSSIVIDEASNEMEAVEKIDLSVPDLVFSGIPFHGENGFELIDKIKSASPLVRVVSMSHENSSEYEKVAIMRGADRYISKSSLTPDVIDELIKPIIVLSRRRKNNDRRKFTRYRPKDPVFIKMKSENEDQLGQLLDIGEGGLSVCCTDSGEPGCKFMDLGIFTMNDEFCMRNIQCRAVCSFTFNPPGANELTDLRRTGLQFLDPEPGQKADLDHFLMNYTIGAT